MKLSTKISMAAVSLLLVFSQVFAVWNLTQTRKRLLETIIEAEAAQLGSDMYQFDRQCDEIRQYAQNEWVERLGAKEAFRDRYSTNTALYCDGEELSNSTPYEFDLSAKKGESVTLRGMRYAQYDMWMYRETVNGRMLLILSVSQERNSGFQMIRYRDITQIYEDSNALFVRGIVMFAVLSLIFLAALLLLLKRILKPFYRLRDAADVMAAGDYTKRIEHPGKDEVGAVARSFNGMAGRVQEHVQELVDTNERQCRLLGALSHELKTPLTGIQGYAELLQKVELSPERQMHALDYIRAECRRLNRLSAKMLQFVALSGEEQIEKRPVDGKKLIEKVKEITVWRLREQKMRLAASCEDGLVIDGDEDLLLSLLTNLIDNAAKAGGQGSVITLTGSRKGLFVKDEGTGIPEEEIRRLTEPFYMVDKSRSRRQGGAGLGLALCAQIARLHGGTLVIQSEVGKGSTIGLQFSSGLETSRSEASGP